MGLFDFFKKKRQKTDDQAAADRIIASINHLANSPAPQPMSAEEYNQMRQREMDWLENHYDFNSLSGVNAIPVAKNLARPAGDSATGEVYYYLKFKAREHEKSGDIELAIACFRKSIALMRLKFGATYGREESYSFVRMLARHGYVEEAQKEKDLTDSFYDVAGTAEDLERFRQVCRDANSFQTDLVIMSVLGATCPECAKYQGRVYSLSGKSKKFPKIPDVIAQTGCVHKGCGHSLFPYIYGVDDPQLDYTLSVHPLQNKRYGKNIIAFSNRPFVDDRTDECRKQAEAIHEKQRIAAERKQRNAEAMIQREYQKHLDSNTFAWLQETFPDKCPKNVAGFKRMRTQNTKNYQALKQLAAELGKEI